MTTIIIIVVVALVFFVTICVVTFMVWKREAEMRTDSIKAIENSLGEMLDGMSGEQAAVIRNRAGQNDSPYDGILQEMQDMQQEIGDKIKKESDSKAIKKRNHDPFGWVKAEFANKKETDTKPETADDNVKDAKENVNTDGERKRRVVNEIVETAEVAKHDRSDEGDRSGNAESYENYEDVTVFKPIERKPRRLKWVEVFEEGSEKTTEAEPEETPPAEAENPKKSLDDSQQDLEAFEETENWDLDEDEPDLWDFDEISRHISGESEYHTEESGSPYELEAESEEPAEIDIEEILENEAAAIEEEPADEYEDETEQTPALAQEDDEFFEELMRLSVQQPERQTDEGTSLDFMKAVGMEELADEYRFDDFSKPPTGYNIGKSGKEYTVSELEVLIKE